MRKKTYAPAIKLGAYDSGESVGNRATHNLMHNLPHAAVLYGGNDNLIQNNVVIECERASTWMRAASRVATPPTEDAANGKE